MPRSIVLAALVCALSAPDARADEPITDLQSWSQVQVTAPVIRDDDRITVALESTVRRGSPASIDDATGRLEEHPVTYLFVRPSIGVEVLPHLQLALGYAFAPVYYDETDRTDILEQRVWEQANTHHRLGRLKLETRSRLEERMRSRGQGHGDTELRLRERLRVAIRLDEAGAIAWIASDELFVFLNETSFASEPGFSENRAFTGLSFRPDAHVAIDLGYLHQFVGGRATTHRSNHVMQTSVSFRIGTSG